MCRKARSSQAAGYLSAYKYPCGLKMKCRYSYISNPVCLFFLIVWTFLCFKARAQSSDPAIAKLQRMAKDSIEVNPELSISLAQQAFDMSQARKEKESAVLSLNLKGAALHGVGRLDEALATFNKGLEIATDDTLKSLRADLLVNLGLLYENRGQYKLALRQEEAALKMFAVLKDTLSMGNCYHNMGVLALHMNNNLLARKNFEFAVDMYTANKDAAHIAGGLIAIGGSYIRDTDYMAALQYLLRGQSINDTLPDGESFAVGNMNIALCYQELGKKDSAMIFYKRAEAYFNTQATSNNQVLLYINMGTIYDEAAQYPKAIACYKLALKYANEISYPMGISFAYGNLAETYEKMGNYKDANKFLNLHMQIKDTLLTREKLEALEEMEAKYKTQELDAHNKLLRNENDLQKLRLRNKDLLIYSGFGLALLSFVIGILFVRQNKLKAARQKLELEQKQLQAQMNPHFIFNCLNSIQQFVLQNDRANANRYLADFALLMRQTLDNSKDGTITLHREIEYLKNYLSFEHMRHEDKFTYTVYCAEDINPYTIEIPAMVIQPFAENAVKHGLCNREGSGGVLRISFYSKQDSLYCEVDDNGIGIKEAQKLKANSFSTHKSSGLDLTRQRLALTAKMQSGDYTITMMDKADAGNGQGTIVTIKFPLYV